jgi:hypothetical protein
MILRVKLAVDYATSRAFHARQVKGDDPDRKGYPGPPGWGLGVGPTTLTRKTRLVKEIETKQNRVDFQKKTFSLKMTARIGCWNVRTLQEEEKDRLAEESLETHSGRRSSRSGEKMAGSEGCG